MKTQKNTIISIKFKSTKMLSLQGKQIVERCEYHVAFLIFYPPRVRRYRVLRCIADANLSRVSELLLKMGLESRL
jgi:hypothetical protein